MSTQIVKWGNAQGIRIPKKIMEECGLRLNDPVNLRVIDGRIVIEKTFRHRSLEERAAEYGGKLGPYSEYDWGEPEGREVW